MLNSLNAEKQELQDKIYNRETVISELSEKLRTLDKELKNKDNIILDLRSQIDDSVSRAHAEKSETISARKQLQAEREKINKLYNKIIQLAPKKLKQIKEIEKELEAAEKIEIKPLLPEKLLPLAEKKIEKKKRKMNPIYVSGIVAIIVGASLLINSIIQKVRHDIADTQYVQAANLYSQGNTMDAYTLLSRAIALSPKDRKIRALFYLVASELVDKYIESKDYKEALGYLKRLRKYYPEDKDIAKRYDEISRRVEK